MQHRLPVIPIVVCLLILAACAPQAVESPTPSVSRATRNLLPTETSSSTPTPSPSPTASPSATPSPTPTPPLTTTPGIMVSGYVLMPDGTGVPGVTICRNFASYNGQGVATTDASGYYHSGFAFIPGDEMIGVWALAPGYTFDPPTYRWRHYYGPEERPLDFTASASTATAVPPAPCP